jgi:hypothetical protein
VVNAVGYLSITTLPATNNFPTDVVWNPNGSSAWMFNNPNGTPGGNPGWTLWNITGQLIINATSSEKFRIDLVTLVGSVAARMPNFDPTRPYSWEIVRTTAGISGFNTDKIDINSGGGNGLYLFANPIHGGTFAVRVSGNSLYLDFTPVGTTRDANTGLVSTGTVPNNYNVGTTNDPATLLGDMVTSDLNVLYLETSSTNPTAQSPVTINVRVANLKQPIVGVDAFIRFSSAHFIATAPGTAGAPQVVAGGSPWDTLIFRMWNTGGDLDTVVGVNIQSSAGTTADGIVAKITLTPTKTMTGPSRVIWRADLSDSADTLTDVVTDLVGTNGNPILPARVPTPLITIANDTTRPSLDPNAMTARQDQPQLGSASVTVDVKGGTSGNRREVVRTGGSGATASGPVVIRIPVSDSGVGLSGPPVVTLTQSGQPDIPLTSTTPGTTNGTYEYLWNVPQNVNNGTWQVNVSASDTISPDPNVTNRANAFSLSVNTREISGIVELQEFVGTNRLVTFKIGDNTGPNADSVRQYDMNLNFTSGSILGAGAEESTGIFQNRSALASRLMTTSTSDTLSTYLRYGDILNLPGMATRILSMQGNLATYVHGLFYGKITNLNTIAAKLTTPTRNVDTYIVGRLSSSTILALAAYNSVPRPAGAPAALNSGILVDFNVIVAGPSIWDPVRFASVTLSTTTLDLLAISNPTADDIIALNRSLLQDAYPEYLSGDLSPTTAQMLSQYPGGTNPALVRGLLDAFETMATDSSTWPPATPPLAQCMYNETVFLGVTLSPATLSMLTSHQASSPLTGAPLTQLNQMLLQDGFAGLYVRPPLQPQTVANVDAFNASDSDSVADFNSSVTTDLNTLINSGSSIYTASRFAPYLPIDANSELGKLLANPSKTPAQQVRENRLLLELGYSSELSKSVLAAFRLVQVRSDTVEVTAKTAWNLRERFPVSPSTTTPVIVNFVTDGVPGWSDTTDHYLRGGDVNPGDNVINLADYNVLRININQTTSTGDANGDGKVDAFFDYTLMQANWARSGDADAR